MKTTKEIMEQETKEFIARQKALAKRRPPSLEDVYRTDAKRAVSTALRKCARIPWQERLEAINALLNGCGVEAIRGEWQNGYWCDVVGSYVNFGDTYDLTVLCIRGERWQNPRFIVSSWGDWVERNGERFGVV